MVKNPTASADKTRDVGSIPGLGRPLGGGNGNALQYSCLENLMDRKAWRATVSGVARVGHDLACPHKSIPCIFANLVSHEENACVFSCALSQGSPASKI